MALSRTQVLTANNLTSAGGTVSITTGSFTPPANSFLVLHVGYINGPGNNSNDVRSGSTSVTGGGLTWTRQLGPTGGATHSPGTGAADYTAVGEIWTAPVGGSPSSMTVTIAQTGATVATDPPRCIAEIEGYTGYNTGSPIGATASAAIAFNSNANNAVSLTLSANPASSSIVQSGQYEENFGSNHNTAAGAGWTEIYDAISVDNGYGQMQGQVRTASTSTSVDWNDTGDNGETNWGVWLYALEIQADLSDTFCWATMGGIETRAMMVGY